MDALPAIVAAIGTYTLVRWNRRAPPRAPAALSAVCVLHENEAGIGGHVQLRAVGSRMTEFTCRLTNLPPGLHGFHVHRLGDLREGCKSACDHYNPSNSTHGGRCGPRRHQGDLGNINADEDGECSDVFRAEVALPDIVGRMLVVHADEDDLGMGKTAESLKTGSAGLRLACGVIGLCD